MNKPDIANNIMLLADEDFQNIVNAMRTIVPALAFRYGLEKYYHSKERIDEEVRGMLEDIEELKRETDPRKLEALSVNVHALNMFDMESSPGTEADDIGSLISVMSVLLQHYKRIALYANFVARGAAYEERLETTLMDLTDDFATMIEVTKKCLTRFPDMLDFIVFARVEKKSSIKKIWHYYKQLTGK